MGIDEEPVERLEEVFIHPADKTFTTLHDQHLSKQKELGHERRELSTLLNRLPDKAPKKGSKAYAEYLQIQSQIEQLKANVCKKHNELMEILKQEEKISRQMERDFS